MQYIKNELREQPRYSCIGIPLLFSPFKKNYVNTLGEKLYTAYTFDMSLSGLAFDVEQSMSMGDKLLIVLPQPENNKVPEFISEEIEASVRWCRKLPSGKYRIGVSLDCPPVRKESITTVEKNDADWQVPSELNHTCPACNTHSTFTFFAYQTILAGKGVMPLYDCSACGTTRSLTGIIYPV